MNGQRIAGVFAAAVLAASLVVGAPASAAPHLSPTTTSEANGLVEQPDGKLVVAGRGLNIFNTGEWAFTLARYTPDGALDPTFGNGGRVGTRIGANGAEAYAVALQPDGKLVAAGRVFTKSAGGEPRFALARYTPDGAQDPTFGDGGIVTAGLGKESTARAVAVQADGRIVAAGEAKVQPDSDFGVARFLPSGALDPEFGTGGMTSLDFGRGDDVARALVIQPDGKVVVAGSATSPDTKTTAFGLFRLNPDGTPDPTFGGQGGVATAVAGRRDSGANALVLQPDGKVVAGGSGNMDGFGHRFALVRYNADGSVDAKVEGKPETGFNGGGIAVAQFCSGCVNDRVRALALQADGSIVAAGHSNRPGGFVMAVARYAPDGSVDPSFAGGLVSTQLTSDSWVNALAATPAGIVAAGTAGPNPKGDVALVRYTPAGTPDPAFGGGGSTVTPFDGMPKP